MPAPASDPRPDDAAREAADANGPTPAADLAATSFAAKYLLAGVIVAPD